MTHRGLCDTSVFIAVESGRPLNDDLMPTELAASVITLAELQAGVLAADDLAVRSRRLATLEQLNALFIVDIDYPTASVWAELRVHLATARSTVTGSAVTRGAITRRTVNVNDMWIAASAIRHGWPVVTQDEDFASMAGVMGLEVIRV
jgi:predicted nucleic acid-binding protein